MNKWLISGRLTRDAEVIVTQNGNACLKFTVAQSEKAAGLDIVEVENIGETTHTGSGRAKGIRMKLQSADYPREVHQYELYFSGEKTNQKIFEIATNDHFRAYQEIINKAVKYSVVGVFTIIQKKGDKLINKREIILKNVMF